MGHLEMRNHVNIAKECCAHSECEKSTTVYIPVRFALFPYPHLYNEQKIWIGDQLIHTPSCFKYFLDAANFTVEWGCDPWVDCGKHVLRGKIKSQSILHEKICKNSVDFLENHSIMKVVVSIGVLDYWRVLWKNLSC